MLKQFKNIDGITMISLAVTVVIMVILAAVTIGSAIDKGILGETSRTAKEAEIKSIKEAIYQDILDKQSRLAILGKEPDLTKDEFIEILKKYGTVTYNGTEIKGVKVDEDHEILLSEIWKGTILP